MCCWGEVNEVRICDFGSARLHLEDGSQTERLGGSPMYLAPKLWDDEVPHTNTVNLYLFALIL
jgi:hypothetical protein